MPGRRCGSRVSIRLPWFAGAGPVSVWQVRIPGNGLPASGTSWSSRPCPCSLAAGKAPVGVARRAKRYGKPVVAVVGGRAVNLDAVRAVWAANALIRLEDDAAALSPADAASRPDLTVAGLQQQGSQLCAWVAFDPVRWAALHALRLSARTLAALHQPA